MVEVVAEEKNESVNLDELRLILHWRHRCHENEDKTRPCPMRCQKEGIDFCHDVATKLVALFSEGLEKSDKKLIEEALVNV